MATSWPSWELVTNGPLGFWPILNFTGHWTLRGPDQEDEVGWTLVVKTFKNPTAKRVPSECSQLRYTSDILEYLFKSTAERVPSECS